MTKEEFQVANLGASQNSQPVMSTVVNIGTEATVRDHIVWSLFNTVLLNPCCLGIVAFAYSVKSRDRKMVGDMIGAQTHGSTARKLNIGALVLIIVVFIALIILSAVNSAVIRISV